MLRKQYLFCPGPFHIAQNVKDASINQEICHREVEFSDLLQDLNNKLLEVFEIGSKKNFHSVFITGSSTAANQSLINAVGFGKNVLVLTNGEFGERLFNTSEFLGNRTSHLDFGWGNEIDLNQVEKCLINNKINVLFVVHHETSTGMLNRIQDLGYLCKKYEILFCVDAVSSVGAEKIDMEEWNIGFCTGGTGKVLGGFPGLSFVIGKKEEFAKLATSSKPLYLDLYNYYKYSVTLNQTPNTPSIPSLLALN